MNGMSLEKDKKKSRFIEDIIKILKLHPVFLPDTKVLDIGCGRGELLSELQKLDAIVGELILINL